MPKLQALHGFSGPEGSFAAGDIFDASEARADFLKANRFAADAPPEEPEAETVVAPVTAAKPKAPKPDPAAE